LSYEDLTTDANYPSLSKNVHCFIPAKPWILAAAMK